MEKNRENKFVMVYEMPDGTSYQIEATAEEHEYLQQDFDHLQNYIVQSFEPAAKENQDPLRLSREVSDKATPAESSKEFLWDRSATLLLIENYNRMKNKFRDPKEKKKTLWTTIKSLFEEQGYEITEDTLDRKFRNLKKTYTTIRDNTKKTGRGRISWEHFDMFEEIFSADKTVNLPLTLSSFHNAVNREDVQVKPQVRAIPDAGTTPIAHMPSISQAIKNQVPAIPDAETTPIVHTPSISQTIEKQVRAIAGAGITPSSSVTRTTRTDQGESTAATKMSTLYRCRKRQLDIEERRCEEIKLLRLSLDEHNKLYAERNAILREMLQSKR